MWASIGTPLVVLALVGGFLAYRTTTTPALTEKDTVVLSAVVNRTGDAMLDDTLGEALGVQLRQSPFLKVVPDQQVQATLRLMGRDPMTPITAAIGRDLCQRAGARALLGGSVATLGTSYVITLSAEDCVTGDVLAEQQAQADSKEGVLKTLGTAVPTFRQRLGESLASIQRYDARIDEATTPSLEALKAYSMGQRTRRTNGDFDSVPFFKRAIELDPDFAIAYARLGNVYNNLNQPDEGRKMTARAFDLRGKVSEAERLYIEARYYTTVKPDPEKAIASYRMTLATYPNDYTSLTNAALLLAQQGNRAEALKNLEQAVRVAPDQPLAWLNLASTYLQAQRLVDARTSVESALKLQDSASGRSTLYQVAIVSGDQALADQQVAAMRGRRDEVDFLLTRLHGSMYQGRFEEASLLATEWQSRMEQASRGARTGDAMINLAINEALVGLTDAARARKDDVDDRDLPSPETPAELALDAILAGRQGLEADESNNFDATPAIRLALLAHAQVELGQPSEARQTYEKLFRMWKDADATLPLLVKAKEEFAKLGAT